MKESSRFTIGYYWKFVKQHKVIFFVSLLFIPLASLIINTIVPYFFSMAIGQLTTKHFNDVSQTLLIASLIGMAGVILNAIGFQALTRLEANVGAKIRKVAFEDLVHKDMNFFVNQKIGAITGKYIDFSRSYVILQDLLIIRTLGFLLSIIIGLILIASKSIIVAGILLLLIIALIIEVRWSIKKREPWREARRKHRSDLFGKVADALTNNLVVKAFGNEKEEIKSINHTNELFRKAFIKDIGFFSIEGSIRIGLMIVTQIIAISISAYLVSINRIDIATAIFCISYLQLIGSQLFAIGELLTGYEQALLDASPLSEILASNNLINDNPKAKKLADFSPKIAFNNVSYSYDDSDQSALANISLDIPAGQKIGLVGQSGAGKTTLSQLMLRFHDVSSGSITIDSIDIRDITQQSLHQAIAYVPQEAVLFHRSLRDNIAYGKPGATDEEIISATKKANAWGFVSKLPQGLDTMVGERGVKLSGGQRQRIAIARAILKDAPILILDEATSALDSESEKLIQTALEKLMKGRTSIVIAHRLSTIANLDRIIVLKKGKIVEDGTHTKLLKQNGIYTKLWQHQFGGFIDE